MLYAQWVAKEPRCHADSEDPCPTGHVTCYFVGFVVRWFNYVFGVNSLMSQESIHFQKAGKKKQPLWNCLY